MKIFVTQKLPPKVEARLKEFCPGTVFRRSSLPPSERELIRLGRDADAIVCLLTDAMNARVIAACGKLKVIATVAVGTDHIDLQACRGRGINVLNTPGLLTETTADLAWALMLAAARRVAEGDRYVRKGRFKSWALDLMLGVDIHGKTLGIIGPGRIGSAVARRAAGFGMRIVTRGRTERPDSMPLETLLRESDFVVITAPLTPETLHMISDRELALMKPTAVLVNVGRGPIVDERALVRALKGRRIFAAGLDVYEREPKVPPELRRLENVVLVPHIGSASFETREGMALMAVDRLIEALR
jgi:glyoxylate reductase